MVFLPFSITGRSLIWNADGTKQHLAALAYYGKYLRQIFHTLMSTGKFVVPHFDFSIGYGSNILTTLNWYAIGDPLNLLFAIVPVSKSPQLYTFLVLLRMYLAGIAFSAYCHKLKLSRSSQLLGSLAYVFCAFALQIIRHPNFLNALIYLPLLFIGVEQVLKKQRPYFLIALVCLAAITDFYFFYMLTILLIIYIVIRIFMLADNKRVKSFFLWAGKFALLYLVGLLMACIVFLPVVMYMLATNRAGIHQAVSLLYSSHYYLSILPAIITTGAAGYWVYLGYPALSFIAAIMLFTKRKAHIALKFALVLLLVFLMLPPVGDVFNGLSYVTNRWIFGLGFVVALITAVMLPSILTATKKQLIAVSIAVGLYGVVTESACLIKPTLGKAAARGFIPAFVVMVVLLLFVWWLYLSRHFGWGKQLSRAPRASLLIIFLLTTLGFGFGAYYKYVPGVSAFAVPNKAIDKLTQNSSAVVKSIGNKAFYRYDENGSGGQAPTPNRSMLRGVNSTGFYFSLTNPNMIDYFINDIALYVHQNCDVGTLDNRTAPGTLASVKYFVVEEGLERYLPYGYRTLVKKSGIYEVYKNNNALPLGYTYDKIISKADYEKLTPIEKQQAMLQGAVIDNLPTPSLETTTPVFNDKVIPYKITRSKSITVKNNTFVVGKKNTSVTLVFSGLKNCETYLYLNNLNYSGGSATQIPLVIRSGGIEKTFNYQTPAHSWYANQHDYLVNLGYAAKQKTELRITFSEKGTYSMDDLQVICQPMAAYPAQVRALKQTTLQNVKMGTDQVTGTVSANQPKLLCLTVPYSGGWSAQIDGKRVGLLEVNTMWCGLYLPAGNHTIALHYKTPYFQQGCILSLVGMFSFAIIIVFHERKRKVLKRKTAMQSKMPGLFLD